MPSSWERMKINYAVLPTGVLIEAVKDSRGQNALLHALIVGCGPSGLKHCRSPLRAVIDLQAVVNIEDLDHAAARRCDRCPAGNRDNRRAAPTAACRPGEVDRRCGLAALQSDQALGDARHSVSVPGAIDAQDDGAWGELHLPTATPGAGRDWTDDRSHRERRQLKHRAAMNPLKPSGRHSRASQAPCAPARRSGREARPASLYIAGRRGRRR